MTAYRVPGTTEAVLQQVLRELTDEELEAATQKKRSTFYAIADPGRREQLQFADALALDRALLGKRKAPRFLHLMQASAEAGPAADAAAVGRQLTRITRELGQLAGVFDRAAEDGRLDLAERRDLAEEADRLARLAIELRDGVKPLAALVGAKAAG